jgi:hypothetical protein
LGKKDVSITKSLMVSARGEASSGKTEKKYDVAVAFAFSKTGSPCAEESRREVGIKNVWLKPTLRAYCSVQSDVF